MTFSKRARPTASAAVRSVSPVLIRYRTPLTRKSTCHTLPRRTWLSLTTASSSWCYSTALRELVLVKQTTLIIEHPEPIIIEASPEQSALEADGRCAREGHLLSMAWEPV